MVKSSRRNRSKQKPGRAAVPRKSAVARNARAPRKMAGKPARPKAIAKTSANKISGNKTLPKKAPASGAPAKGKWVYRFGNGKAEGRAEMRSLLGGKGAGLAEMANLGLPVPPGFTITTEVCTSYYENANSYPKELERQVNAALAQVGRLTGKSFGDKANPLLVSVRSGGR